MTILAQPETYSDVLQRVFTTTLTTGLGCSLALAAASPQLKALLEVVAIDADFGPVKGLKLLYIAVPLALALISRAIKLHDRVSDLLGLRRLIDTRYILFPLAEGAGVELDEPKRLALALGRVPAMYRVFYPYVSLPDSKIDRQLIRTALDNLGWLWVAIEALVLLLPTSCALLFLERDALTLTFLVITFSVLVFAYLQWFVCKRSSLAEVRAILADEQHRRDIAAYLNNL